MPHPKVFSKERFSDLLPIIERMLELQPGEEFWVKCPDDGKSPHTVGQKLRDFLKEAKEENPDADIDPRSYAVSVLPEVRKIRVRKKALLTYGAYIIEE